MGINNPSPLKDILKLTSWQEFSYILHASPVKILMMKCWWPMCLDLQRATVSHPELLKTKARPGVINCMPNLRMKENCGGTSERNRMKSSKNALNWIETSKQLWREKLKNSPNWRNWVHKGCKSSCWTRKWLSPCVNGGTTSFPGKSNAILFSSGKDDGCLRLVRLLRSTPRTFQFTKSTLQLLYHLRRVWSCTWGPWMNHS